MGIVLNICVCATFVFAQQQSDTLKTKVDTVKALQNVAQSVQCKATTKKGTQCKRTTKDKSGYCWQHTR